MRIRLQPFKMFIIIIFRVKNMSYYSLKRILTIFLFLLNFLAKTAGFREDSVFLLSGQGVTLPTPLVV